MRVVDSLPAAGIGLNNAVSHYGGLFRVTVPVTAVDASFRGAYGVAAKAFVACPEAGDWLDV